MKPLQAIVIRFLAVSLTAFGLATLANWINHRNYWQGTIRRVQTVDFNMLSHTLPTKLSSALIQGQTDELQRTLDSTYGNFGLVITDCREPTWSCPDQEILWTTQASDAEWYQQLERDGIEFLQEFEAPFSVLRNPPPVLTENNYINARDHQWRSSGLSNSGEIIGRVYYVRGIPPSFADVYGNWLQRLPNSLFSGQAPDQYYGLTVGLFLLGAWGTLASFEIILAQKRSQQKQLQAVHHQRLTEAQKLTQQLTQRLQDQLNTQNALLQECQTLKLAQEAAQAELASSVHSQEILVQEQQQIRERNLAKIVALEKQLDALQAEYVSTQEDIRHRDAQLIQWQDEIATLRLENQYSEQRETILETDLAAYRQKLQEATQRIDYLANSMQAVTLERDEAIARITELQADLDASRTQMFQNQDLLERSNKLAEDLELAQENLENHQTHILEISTELKNSQSIQELALTENTKLTQENQQLRLELEQLKSQLDHLWNTGLETNLGHQSASVTQTTMNAIVLQTSEPDLYPREKYDLLLEILNYAQSYVHENSRRAHILSDLLEQNRKSGERDAIAEELKNLLSGYTRMSSGTEKALKRLGFEISEDGKHYKAVFCGDRRYTVSLAKTGSDRRGGDNALSEIRNRFL
jgi:hypothetical protein